MEKEVRTVKLTCEAYGKTMEVTLPSDIEYEEVIAAFDNILRFLTFWEWSMITPHLEKFDK